MKPPASSLVRSHCSDNGHHQHHHRNRKSRLTILIFIIAMSLYNMSLPLLYCLCSQGNIDNKKQEALESLMNVGGKERRVDYKNNLKNTQNFSLANNTKDPNLVIVMPFISKEIPAVTNTILHWQLVPPCHKSFQRTEKQSPFHDHKISTKLDLWLVVDDINILYSSPELIYVLSHPVVQECFENVLVVQWICNLNSTTGTPVEAHNQENKERQDVETSHDPHFWCTSQFLSDVLNKHIHNHVNSVRYRRRDDDRHNSNGEKNNDSILQEIDYETVMKITYNSSTSLNSNKGIRSYPHQNHDYFVLFEHDLNAIQPEWALRLLSECQFMSTEKPPIWVVGNVEQAPWTKTLPISADLISPDWHNGNVDDWFNGNADWFNGNAIYSLHNKEFVQFASDALDKKGYNKPFDISLWKHMEEKFGKEAYWHFFHRSDLFFPYTGYNADYSVVPVDTYLVHTARWKWDGDNRSCRWCPRSRARNGE